MIRYLTSKRIVFRANLETHRGGIVSNTRTLQSRWTRFWLNVAAIFAIVGITIGTTYPDYPGSDGKPLVVGNTQTTTAPTYPMITFADLPYGCTVNDGGVPDMTDPLCSDI